MSNEGALASLDIQSALQRIAAGTLSKTIAAEYGVTKQSLRERLVAHPDYKEAIKDQAASLVEDATEDCMKDVNEMPVIARARLKLEAAHKWARARDPDTWGDKQQIQHSGPGGGPIPVAVAVAFIAPQQRIVEGEKGE